MRGSQERFLPELVLSFVEGVETTTRGHCAFVRKIFLRDLRASFVVKTVFGLRLYRARIFLVKNVTSVFCLRLRRAATVAVLTKEGRLFCSRPSFN